MANAIAELFDTIPVGDGGEFAGLEAQRCHELPVTRVVGPVIHSHTLRNVDDRGGWRHVGQG